MGARKTVRIGVFLPSEAQLLDTACIDVFSMMGHGYLSVIPFLPKHVLDLAPEVWIAYIGSTAPGTLSPLTAGMKTPITYHFSDPEVAPGKLDIVLVPGPPPDEKWGEDVLGWLRAQMAYQSTDCLSVCTGIYLFGEAGLLKGKKACGPRGMQDDILKKYPGVTLLGHELRWVQDGNFWSSGGITNGNDLVAAYARQSKHFPSPIVELATNMADVGDRPQKYSVGQTAFTAGIVWQLLKAWVMSFGKSKSS